jgi:hypothetical protein
MNIKLLWKIPFNTIRIKWKSNWNEQIQMFFHYLIVLKVSGVIKIINKLSTEPLLEVYEDAIKFNVSRDFIKLVTEN